MRHIVVSCIVWLMVAVGATLARAGTACLPGSSQSAQAVVRLNEEREIARNALLQRELALTSERLRHRREELRWMLGIVALAGVIVALLTWLLIANGRHRRELSRMAHQDALTGLPNRRSTSEQAAAALASAGASNRPVTIALIDLDRFKSINDRCGHAVGDRVLQEFARLAREILRVTDTLGRWGGEEFLLILPETALDEAVTIINRMREATAVIQLPETARGLSVSFSAGLATRSTDAQPVHDVIASADAALYEAKSGGRNLLRLDRETHQGATSGVLQSLNEGV
jgi:diguanylate cyclase (GGDEF)-like protein